MRPHDSQTSRENATPSSGTSPLASYKEVAPPPPPSRVVFPLGQALKLSILTGFSGYLIHDT